MSCVGGVGESQRAIGIIVVSHLLNLAVLELHLDAVAKTILDRDQRINGVDASADRRPELRCLAIDVGPREARACGPGEGSEHSGGICVSGTHLGELEPEPLIGEPSDRAIRAHLQLVGIRE